MRVLYKTIHDYYDKLYEMFPEVSKKDIQRIVLFGWKQFAMINGCGGDTFLLLGRHSCVTGQMYSKDALSNFKHYKKKLCIKLRLMYYRKGIQWDGYHYFSTKDKIDVNTFNDTVRVYKIKDEALLNAYDRKYLYKVKDIGIRCFEKAIDFKDCPDASIEYVEEINGLVKYKDMLVSNHKYEFI